MGTGYVRADTSNNIAPGNTISANDLDNEFDAVESAFNGSTGHSHDGTIGEGPQIATDGIADGAVTNAKVAANAAISTSKIDGLNAYAELAGASFTGDVSGTNLTLTGYLRGPSSFTIDPATHGDDTGTLVIAGNLQVDGTTTTINSTTLTVDDLNVVVASGAIDASAANGAGLTVDGANASLTYGNTADDFTFNKALNSTGSMTVLGDSAAGKLVLNCEVNTHGVTIQGPPHSAAATYTLTLPNTDGNADQVLKTDGSGNLDWVDQSAGITTGKAIAMAIVFGG